MNEGTITLGLESDDRSIYITLPEYVTLWELGARFREFALALGFSPRTVDELITPDMIGAAINGDPVFEETAKCCGGYTPCSPHLCNPTPKTYDNTAKDTARGLGSLYNPSVIERAATPTTTDRCRNY